ncbi:hypothetical protein PMKS-003535 [Pichia membranifaciens]|uniref:Uncharacterized protein n=1 Tax=Pichia membranifaciens TaxID=4926 RepID=A0A1Q2YKG6_9ASCO|nr:hypothetical protein PMKS-003535 [Pichia membranifaciens]
MSGIKAACSCIKSCDGINTGYESTTGLTTFYKLNGFRAWLKKQDFPDKSIVYAVEIKQIMYYLFFHFASKEHFMNLDVANTGTMRVETAMGNHTIGTLDRYLKFLSTVYFYLLNVGKYQNSVELNEEIVDKIKVLRDSVEDAADKQAISSKPVGKESEAVFSFPVKDLMKAFS